MMNWSSYKNIRKSITKLGYSDKEYFSVAKDVYNYQISSNPVFKEYLKLLGKSDQIINSYHDFVFLPIEHFKSQIIKTGNWKEEVVFRSSGTTASMTSKHFVKSLSWYFEGAVKAFEAAFVPLKDSVIIGLLPSYLERQDSSLVAMVQEFINRSESSESGFYLHQYEELRQKLLRLINSKKQVFVFGVSFALLDFADLGPFDFKHIAFVETGGMKGRRKELTRMELHHKLKSGFNVSHIYSEYGMTELLSQAYLLSSGFFKPSAQMRVLANEINDPASFIINKTGQLNIIDLNNIDSCSFIQTSDLGRVYKNSQFEVLGRLDFSDIRGCNLLLEDIN
jgi:hypothetical protein